MSNCIYTGDSVNCIQQNGNCRTGPADSRKALRPDSLVTWRFRRKPGDFAAPRTSTMTRKDRILIAAFLGIAAVLAIFLYVVPFLRPQETAAADRVVVTIDGQFYKSFPLDEDHEEDIDTSYGHNHLSIRDGYAQVTEADCPDGICIYQGKVKTPGEMIVCLPHRMIAEIVSGSEAGAGGGGVAGGSEGSGQSGYDGVSQ